ncbi:MAG: DNA polymerase III subunit delta [Bacteroidales bacterium]|nr:MAG: DNA polymerase III subunit delta [Bacteroidales bacterium]
MLFRNIVGQKKIKTVLLRTIREGRISHAQLLLGPEGCGNLALAIACAQYLSCDNREEEDSCGTCPSCMKYEKLIHPDLHFVYPVSTTRTVTKDPVSSDFINEWRMMVMENPYMRLNQWYEAIGIENKQGTINKSESYEIIRILNLKTFESEFKVMIIWMPEKMNHVAANKLLKILEEPPPKTLFLLVSEDTDKMLPTILSRAQLIKIPKVDDESIIEALKQKTGLTGDGLNDIVRLANGNYLLARELIEESEENTINFNHFTLMMRLSYGRKIHELIAWIDQLAGNGREKQKQFLRYSLRLIRENYMLNIIPDGKREMIFLTGKETGFSRRFSPYINEKNVNQIAEEMNTAYNHIAANANSRIVFLDLCLRLIKLIKM